MFKYTVTYEDFNGNTRTEDLYFNLSKSEMIKLDNSVPGGMGNKLLRISRAADNVEIMQTLDWLLRSSYGIKSDDGRRFVKGDALYEEFMQTEAYNVFFTDLLEKENLMTEFIRKVMPIENDEQWNAVQEKMTEYTKPEIEILKTE